jgi:SAM-dependent methyltransferase
MAARLAVVILASCIAAAILPTTAISPTGSGPSARERVFTQIFESNYWGSPESRSGAGSTIEITANVRAFVGETVQRLGVRSVLDAACGDMTWQPLIPELAHDGVRSLGLDIVPELVEKHAREITSARPAMQFAHADFTDRDQLFAALTSGGMPPVTSSDARTGSGSWGSPPDLIIARDVLGHLSTAAGLRGIRNFEATGARWLITTYFPSELRNPSGSATFRNPEIAPGRWYPVVVEEPPFRFPRPVDSVAEVPLPRFPDDPRLRGSIGAFPDKRIGLWRLPVNATWSFEYKDDFGPRGGGAQAEGAASDFNRTERSASNRTEHSRRTIESLDAYLREGRAFREALEAGLGRSNNLD